MLHGAPTDSFATDLKKGYKEVLKPKLDSGEYKLVAEQAVPNWDGQQALTIFEQMLQKTGNKIDGVVAANDTLANSVIAAQQARKLDLVPVTGLDATAQGGPAHPGRRAGDDRVLLDQGPGDQGRQPGGPDRPRREADRHRDRGRQRRQEGADDLPQAGDDPKDNIADTVIADDFVAWKDVCIGKYKQYCPPDAQ